MGIIIERLYSVRCDKYNCKNYIFPEYQPSTALYAKDMYRVWGKLGWKYRNGKWFCPRHVSPIKKKTLASEKLIKGTRLLGSYKGQRVKINGKWITFDTNIRSAIWGKTQGMCIYCGAKLNHGKPRQRNPHAFTVDHFLPRKLGGGEAVANLVPSCYRCNNKKGEKHPKDFLKPKTYTKLLKELHLKE